MTLVESLQVALFNIAVVFIVLTLIWALIRIFSICLNSLSTLLSSGSDKTAAANDDIRESFDTRAEDDKLKLQNVDEPTAAIIMAIVSDESGIPLDELNFKSIKKIK